MRITPKNPVKTANIFGRLIRSERTGMDKSKVNKGAEKTSAVASASKAPEKATKDKAIAIIPDAVRMARSRAFRVLKSGNPPLNWISNAMPRKVQKNLISSSSEMLNCMESSLTRRLMTEKQMVLTK